MPLITYHGGGPAAMFEPLTEHLGEFTFGVGQYMSSGVAACIVRMDHLVRQLQFMHKAASSA